MADRSDDEAVLEEAARVCDGRLQQAPDQPRLLRLRARLAMREGLEDFARACLLRAVALGEVDGVSGVDGVGGVAGIARVGGVEGLDGIRAACYGDLGDLWQRKQRRAEALAAYVEALRLAPGDQERYLALGRELRLQHRHAEAAAIYQHALRRDPTWIDVHLAWGDACLERGGVVQAFAHYEEARALDPEHVEVQRRLARAHAERRDWPAAFAVLRRALSASPASAGLHSDHGELLLRSGDAERAAEACRRALNLGASDVRVHRLLVRILERLNRPEELVGAWVSLGLALDERGNDLSGAAETYEAAIACKPDCLRALMKASHAMLRLGRPQEARRYVEAAIAVDPGHNLAHTNLGWILRLLGDFARGWQETAWIYQVASMRRFEQPLWDGSDPGGRTILFWADFALGDTIQDLRFLRLVRSRWPGARIVVECDPRLVSLVESSWVCDRASSRLAGQVVSRLADQVVAQNAPLPPFDVCLPLRRLPEVLEVELDTLPDETPYLHVDPSRLQMWRDRLAQNGSGSSHLSVGIVWACDVRRPDARVKSASLIDFAPLAGLDGVRFVSLQLGPRASELMAPPLGLSVERMLDEACDAADTAAAIAQLDLVVTVDTMVAHLAGAFGRPVWVLAAHSPAWWLWHVEGDRSRWYPTMRVFRQERPGDWEGVLARVREALEGLVAAAARNVRNDAVHDMY